jgi:hypothetical protein
MRSAGTFLVFRRCRRLPDLPARRGRESGEPAETGGQSRKLAVSGQRKISLQICLRCPQVKIVRVTPHKTSPIRDTPHVVPPAYGCFRTPPTQAPHRRPPTGGAATTPAARPPARRGRDATRYWRARANSTRTPRSPVANYVPHPPPYTRAGWCFPRGRRVAEVPEAGGHQRSSEVISGHQSSIRGTRWHAVAIGGNQH